MNKEKWDLLTNEELCELYQQTKDNTLFEYFLARNKSLISAFIQKYIRKCPEYRDDIESLATMELWEAMSKFDKDKDTKFSTFYHYYVLKALSTFYRQLYMIRIPAYKLYDPESLDKALCTSLNMTLKTDNDEHVELIEVLEDDSVMACDDYIERDPDHTQLNKALSILDGRTQQCLRYYIGLVDGNPHTLESIGEIYGVTRERIRQILAKGVKKLKRYIGQYLDVEGYKIDLDSKVYMSLCKGKGDYHGRAIKRDTRKTD